MDWIHNECIWQNVCISKNHLQVILSGEGVRLESVVYSQCSFGEQDCLHIVLLMSNSVCTSWLTLKHPFNLLLIREEMLFWFPKCFYNPCRCPFVAYIKHLNISLPKTYCLDFKIEREGHLHPENAALRFDREKIIEHDCLRWAVALSCMTEQINFPPMAFPLGI